MSTIGINWHLGFATALALQGAVAARASCNDVLPLPAPSTSSSFLARPVTAQDLVGLRDIGQPDPSFILPESPLAVSPDGRAVSFLINRADPVTNSYCRAVVVSGVDAGATVHVIDRGGELIRAYGVRRGLMEPNGFPDLIVPAWSPDGVWIAYLRRDNGVTQVWRARATGGNAAAVTQGHDDVESFAWSADGNAIIYATRPGLRDQQRRLDSEGKTGFLYNERFVPNWGNRPQLHGPAERYVASVSIVRGTALAATADESATLASIDARYESRTTAVRSTQGGLAGTFLATASPLAPLQLWATDAGGQHRTCTAAACTGSITGLWWGQTAREIWFLRREGWANGSIGLYRWKPGSPSVTLALSTDDLLQGCRPAGEVLLCLRENATTPRRLVAIDMPSGRSRLVFDPNPEFHSIRLGTVERIKFKNSLGLEAWGDLALPPGYHREKRLPLIVVQYHSDGFLRGGTGDEYPIHPFAAHGFAVLSFERPTYFAATVPGVKTYADVNAVNAKDWADRRNVLSALEAGVEKVIAMRIADPKRIGLTGLSDGATTTRFALINSKLFSAAAISTCCIEPNTVMTYGGIAWAEDLRSEGYPPATRPDPNFWRPMSMALNAAAMKTPLLMQLSDNEYLLGLEAFGALREQGHPVEMYVFPDEYHFKWQPAHRLAIYERNLDWFSFWFQSVVDHNPDKADQYRRWTALRAAVSKREAGLPPAPR